MLGQAFMAESIYNSPGAPSGVENAIRPFPTMELSWLIPIVMNKSNVRTNIYYISFSQQVTLYEIFGRSVYHVWKKPFYTGKTSNPLIPIKRSHIISN